ncbi:MAG TPA: T9SS type A sorting domain-containing protein [Candidatus Cloacimonadota bacterium]|nr:T9SS type A sorting domain-containing protein [Candidatus Cloacimonadota bacterium]
MYAARFKTALVALTILVTLLISSAIFADCDMMAMIAKKGTYISWLNTSSGNFNDPYDFFTWQKARSNNNTYKVNNDGYGVIYYPEDGTFNANTQSWYQKDDYPEVDPPATQYYPYETFYTSDGTSYSVTTPWGWTSDWQDELDTAEIHIMDDETEASIVLAHARQGSTGEGNHPFRFIYTNPQTEEVITFTFMHNGTLNGTMKSEIKTFLCTVDIDGGTDNWFNLHPLNWLPNPYSAVLNDFIDSELYFHYIMYHLTVDDDTWNQISINNGDIIPRLYKALNDLDENNVDVQTYLRNVNYNGVVGAGNYSANFVLSDGKNIYAFRNDDDSDHSLGIEENGGFIGIRTLGSGYYDELSVCELAVFTPYGYPHGFDTDYNPTRITNFLLPDDNYQPLVFKKGTITQDLDHSIENENESRVWITGNITINSDIDIVNGTEVGVLAHVIIEIDGATLTIEGGAALHLNHASTIDVVGSDSELYLDWGSKITGAHGGWYEQVPPGHIAGNEEWISGDRIIVQNGGLITTGDDQNPGDEITIASSSGELWDGIYITNPTDISPYWFVNCNITGICDLVMQGSVRPFASINFYETNFHDNVQLLVRDRHTLNVDDCDFTDNSWGIRVFNSPATIEYSTITGNGTGINMNYSGGENSTIKYCDINDNDGNGFVFRDREIDFQNNNVQNNNYHGVMAYSIGSFSHFLVNGNYSISNNGWAEYGGYEDSYTWASCGNNISDDNYIYSTDKYILKVFGWQTGDDPVDVYGNNIIHTASERFYPSINAFNFGVEIPDEKMMFDAASEDMNSRNYTAARTTFEDIIAVYPESIEAAASLQKIYFIENYTDQDYDDLLVYTENITALEGSTLYRVKRDVTTKIYMQKEEYDTAIDRLETVIADPADEIELTDALIDEAYCYVKLVEEGSRALPTQCTLKPENFREFQQIVSELDNKLFQNEEPDIVDIVHANIVLSNHPNPFNPITTINYSIPQDSKVELSVYNMKGQKVNQLVNEHLEAGQHTAEWNGKDFNNKSVASGLYFYKISAGKDTAMKKMLLLK